MARFSGRDGRNQWGARRVGALSVGTRGPRRPRGRVPADDWHRRRVEVLVLVELNGGTVVSVTGAKMRRCANVPEPSAWRAGCTGRVDAQHVRSGAARLDGLHRASRKHCREDEVGWRSGERRARIDARCAGVIDGPRVKLASAHAVQLRFVPGGATSERDGEEGSPEVGGDELAAFLVPAADASEDPRRRDAARGA